MAVVAQAMLNYFIREVVRRHNCAPGHSRL